MREFAKNKHDFKGLILVPGINILADWIQRIHNFLPELCNYHCTHKCEIGQKYIPQVDVQDLPSIILSTVATLNDIQPLVNRLIQITMDGKISDDEIPDFALISTKLDEISTASDVLRLWIEKTIQVNKLNGTLFYEEVDKLKK